MLLFVGFFLVVKGVEAQSILDNAADFAMEAVSSIINTVIYLLGSLLTQVLIPVLIGVASYNDFIANPVVQKGWVLTRDVANMFFIVVLLIIAFSTMLQIKAYHYRQWLIKLIIMAVLTSRG